MTRRYVTGDDNEVWLNHKGCKKQTPVAKLFAIARTLMWVPKSVIIDENEEHLCVQKWWADKKELESDWK